MDTGKFVMPEIATLSDDLHRIWDEYQKEEMIWATRKAEEARRATEEGINLVGIARMMPKTEQELIYIRDRLTTVIDYIMCDRGPAQRIGR